MIRSGTLLYGKKIDLRSFLLIAYFFLATFLSHVELIHEINLSRDDKKGNYILSTGTKTSNQTVVFYHGIFRFLLAFVCFIDHDCFYCVIDFCCQNVFYRDIIAEH